MGGRGWHREEVHRHGEEDVQMVSFANQISVVCKVWHSVDNIMY